MPRMPRMPRKPRKPRKARLAGYLAVLVAALFAGWAAWPLMGSADDGGGTASPYDRERDKVTAAATRHIAALNSMDATDLDRRLGWWLDASAGPLHDQLRQGQAAARARFTKEGANAEGTVTSLAVTALDAGGGKATVIAAVRVRLTPLGKPVTEQRKRYQAELLRTPAGWKVSTLTAIGVPR